MGAGPIAGTLCGRNQRHGKLDVIIKKLDEDNATGRLSNDRFDKMHVDYEAEQTGLQSDLERLSTALAAVQNSQDNARRFLSLVKKHTDFSELTPEIVRVFIDRIVIHQAEGYGKNREQEIDVYYNFVGLLREE